MRVRFTRLACTVAMLVLTPPALADRPPDITREEIAMLPTWCGLTQGFFYGEPGRLQYLEQVRRYGESWIHMHHFCWALVDSFRLYRMNAGKPPQYANYNRAISNIDYVLSNTSGDLGFVFRPDLWSHRIKLLRRAKRVPQAIQSADELIKEWPKLPDGYVLMADLMLGINRRDDAMQVLSKANELVEDKVRFEKLKATMLNKP